MFRIFLFIFSIILLISCNNTTHSDTKDLLFEEDTSAIEVLSLQIRETPTNDALFAERAELYFKENKIEEAINDYQIAHKLDTTKIEYYLKLSDYQLVLGRSAMVKEILDKCHKYYPNNIDAVLRLARLHLYVQQYKESAKFVDKAKEIDPHFAETYFIKALIFKETGDTAKAINNFLIATQKEPEYYEAFVMLGLLNASMHNDIAIDYYNNAIDIHPKSFEANYNLAIYYQDNYQLEKAIEQYDHILTNIDSTASIVYFNKGYIKLVIEQKFEEAIPFYLKTIELDPTYYEAIHNLGVCYEQLGDYDNARIQYKRVIELQPNYELSIAGLNRLDNLTN